MMLKFNKVAGSFATSYQRRLDLSYLGIKTTDVLRNLSVAELYERAALRINPADYDTKPTVISASGAMCSYSGKKTGRSPKEKRIVKDHTTEKEIWWGDVNIPLEPESFKLLEERAVAYLSSRPRLYVVDGFAGWDPKYRIKVRVICSRAYHALFMRNMLIVPTPEEITKEFSEDIDYHIVNAGEFPASMRIKGVTSETCVSLNFSERKVVILGTQYAGEMKKGILTIMHYLMPKRGILSLHSSANEGEAGDVTLLFGLSGTGKTTLSADPKRKLIGDDEHCWSQTGVFNVEGGCYAKVVGLKKEKEPEIYDAIKFGAVLENVLFYDEHTREVNYYDTSITENTRVAYPLEFIPGAKIPAYGGHPKNILFLTCDAFGVLPPVSKLTYEQAMYHFISGYTAKVAGTEMGIKEPQMTFSACFGEAFLPLHPVLYAEMLAKKMKEHTAQAWLINTGWSGGKYGVGERIKLKYTRAIIDAIHSGELEKVSTEQMPVFGLQVPTSCPGVPSEILFPRNTWTNKEEYDETLQNLAVNFNKNFEKYKDKESPEIASAGPQVSGTTTTGTPMTDTKYTPTDEQPVSTSKSESDEYDFHYVFAAPRDPKRKFEFRPITKDTLDAAIEQVKNNFAAGEPIGHCLGLTKEKMGESYTKVVRRSFEEKLGLICFEQATGKIAFVAAACDNYNAAKDPLFPPSEDPVVQEYNEVFEEIEKEDEFIPRKFNDLITWYIVSCSKEFQGLGLAHEVFKFCRDKHPIMSKSKILLGTTTNPKTLAVTNQLGWKTRKIIELLKYKNKKGEHVLKDLPKTYKKLGLKDTEYEMHYHALVRDWYKD